jgi:hypothetical protein
MNKNLKYYSLIIITAFTVLGSLNKTNAQCLENLRQARTIYDEGRLHEIYDVLKGCLEGDNLNEEEKTEAYRLIILSYIYQDQPLKADEAMLGLLHMNKLYKTDPETDPNELINLYGTFRTDPIYRYGGKFNVNYSLVNVINTYSIGPSDVADGLYNSQISIGGALFIERDFFQNKVALRLEGTYSIYQTQYTAKGFQSETDTDISINQYDNTETQSWAGMNLLAKYSFMKNSALGKKINPYILLGPSVQFLVKSASANQTTVIGGETATGKDIIFSDEGIRENLNLSLIAGLGTNFPFGKISGFIELMYQHGFSDITNNHNSSELAWRYAIAISDVSMSTLNINLGLMINKYSPKKLTE